MRLRTYGFAVFVALFLTAIPALAHHALQAEFDTTKRGEFTGVLTRFALVNPHVRWFFDVKAPDGTVIKWEVAAAGAGPIRQAGLARAFKLGDTYRVTYAPARNGSNRRTRRRLLLPGRPEGDALSRERQQPERPLVPATRESGPGAHARPLSGRALQPRLRTEADATVRRSPRQTRMREFLESIQFSEFGLWVAGRRHDLRLSDDPGSSHRRARDSSSA